MKLGLPETDSFYFGAGFGFLLGATCLALVLSIPRMAAWVTPCAG